MEEGQQYPEHRKIVAVLVNQLQRIEEGFKAVANKDKHDAEGEEWRASRNHPRSNWQHHNPQKGGQGRGGVEQVPRDGKSS